MSVVYVRVDFLKKNVLSVKNWSLPDPVCLAS